MVQMIRGSGLGSKFLVPVQNGRFELNPITCFNILNPGADEIRNMLRRMMILGIPGTGIGVLEKKLKLDYYKTAGQRNIICNFDDFLDGKTFSCNIKLLEPDMDTMVIATPWAEKETAFYYNQKINCMRASGSAYFNGKEYKLNPETDFGTLDWGRGVWTYDNTWYWGSGNGVVNGKPFGFNIGYGFGNTAAASENIIFYDGKGHKFDDISFNIPTDENGNKDYMSPWTFTSSDGRFEADFIPVLDRAAKIDVKFIITDQHQVFGRMSGKAVLDNGKVIEFKDLLCFAEDVHNKY
jgi:hypothetical protein